ncbi:transposable element tcb1 transposase [Plakobranchus ocellatus]|uniref:Transposable element tcb1 transposase n=1 Tax=Plakobranchus ocellatus TaxID=259542 RepID=A0AAV3YPW5_9GAST|nr:transposable element tcb1 transposase [Plakobranchus ocellatus]
MRGLKTSVYMKALSQPKLWADDGVGWNHNRLKNSPVHIPAARNGTNYVTTILQLHVAPFMLNHPGYILQQDNDPAHRARETQAYLAGEQIGVIHPWPAVSPDINPTMFGTFSAVTTQDQIFNTVNSYEA